MQQSELIFRCGGLVLAGDQPTVYNYFRCVRLRARVDCAGLLKHRLWIVRDDEAASECSLQLLVGLKGEPGHLTATNPFRNISESDRAVANGSNHFVLRPKIFK